VSAPDHAVYADLMANPDDDGPRRVYADWLIERGDPRGELIVVQCELATAAANDPRRPELERRANELLADAGARWRTELRLPEVKVAGHATNAQLARGSTLVFRRGLIDEAKLHSAELAAIGSALAHIPLRRLIITDLDDAGATEIAALPAVPTLIALKIRDATLATAGGEALGTAPLVAAVRELELHRTNLDGEAIDQLGSAGALPAIVALALVESHTLRLARLAEASWLPQLQSFVLARHFGAAGLVDVLQATAWRDIRVLDLHDTYVGDGALALLAYAPIAARLTKLVIPAAHVGPETLRAFASTPLLGELKRLELHGYCNLEPDEVARLRQQFGERLWIEGPIHIVP